MKNLSKVLEMRFREQNESFNFVFESLREKFQRIGKIVFKCMLRQFSLNSCIHVFPAD